MSLSYIFKVNIGNFDTYRHHVIRVTIFLLNKLTEHASLDAIDPEVGGTLPLPALCRPLGVARIFSGGALSFLS